MMFIRNILVVVGLISLVACGSDDNGLNEVSLTAELDQGTQWHETLELGQFPSVLSSPEHGSLSLGNNRVTYTPEQDFRGTDQARVEGRSAVYVFTFIVKPVNQPPQLINTSIQVIANREIEGQLDVYDQDGDEISFELLQAPERGEFRLEQSGYFHYQMDDLTLPNASFTVALSDGVNEPVAETVTLLPAYSTNEEKAAYYYFSRHSHLLQAEQRLRQLESDIDTVDAYKLLAQGYVLASMDDEVDRISNLYIRGQKERAENAFELSKAYQARGETDKAAALRREAFEIFTQMVVDNGIENMGNSDGLFYMTLQGRSRAAGDSELTMLIDNQLRIFIDYLGGGEYKNALGFIAQSLRRTALEYLEELQNTGSQAALELALQNVNALSYLVEVAGYQDFPSRPRHYRIAPLYSDWTTELYYFLGEFEAAKRQLAYTMSFYGRADYDQNYLFDPKPYAEATLDQYPTTLTTAAANFFLLYPDSDTNIPLTMLQEDDRNYARAEANIIRQTFIKRALDGESIDAVMDDLVAYFADSPREQTVELTQIGSQNLRLSGLLRRFGLIDEANIALQRAYDILQSPAYAEENAGVASRLTGTSGCFKLVNLTMQAGDQSLAQSRARGCESLLGDATQDIFTNLTNVMATYLLVGLASDSRSLYEQAMQALDIEKAEGLEQAQANFTLARLLAHGREYQLAVDTTQAGLEQLHQADLSTTSLVNNALDAYEALTLSTPSSGVGMPADSVLVEMRSHAYNAPSFQPWMLELNQRIAAQLLDLNAVVLAFPAPDHESMSKRLVEALSNARLYSEAEQAIRSMNLGDAEQVQLNALISEVQSLQDDFPASLIATVDTDLDGRANFFAVSATTEQLSNTDIELDDDADGDGVKDEDDPQPLG